MVLLKTAVGLFFQQKCNKLKLLSMKIILQNDVWENTRRHPDVNYCCFNKCNLFIILIICSSKRINNQIG